MRSERNGSVRHDKRGKLELCEKGTILLDEITEMPMSLQSKLRAGTAESEIRAAGKRSFGLG